MFVKPMPSVNTSPSREFIVSDPSKLDMFARTAAIRAGSIHTYGALSGYDGLGGLSDAATADGTQAAGSAGNTVGSFFRSLGSSLFGNQAPPPVLAAPPPVESPLPMILGVAAVGAIGFAVWKMTRK